MTAFSSPAHVYILPGDSWAAARDSWVPVWRSGDGHNGRVANLY